MTNCPKCGGMCFLGINATKLLTSFQYSFDESRQFTEPVCLNPACENYIEPICPLCLSKKSETTRAGGKYALVPWMLCNCLESKDCAREAPGKIMQTFSYPSPAAVVELELGSLMRGE